MEPFNVLFQLLFFFFFFLHFKTSPRLLQLFRRMLRRCFAVTLQKCFVDYETLFDIVKIEF